jgi:hypothetical protein
MPSMPSMPSIPSMPSRPSTPSLPGGPGGPGGPCSPSTATTDIGISIGGGVLTAGASVSTEGLNGDSAWAANVPRITAPVTPATPANTYSGANGFTLHPWTDPVAHASRSRRLPPLTYRR